MFQSLKKSISTTIAIAVLLTVAPTVSAQDTPQKTVEAPLTAGVGHIGLTVSDLDASAGFFIDVLGWRLAGERPNYPAKFVTDGNIFVTLWRATDPATATPFNRKSNVGLHHLALAVNDLETLDEIYVKLQTLPNVTIEFAPENLGAGPTQHMMIREPSGNRIEFIVSGGKRRAE